MTSSGQIITEWRRSKGLTQEELAEHIGVSRQTIAMWEIGKRLPTDSVAILAARFLGLDEEDLLSLLQNERLRLRIERLQYQYGANIIIAEAPNHGGMTVDNRKHTAYQSQQGVYFVITQIHKSIGFEYPEKLMKAKRDKGSFDAPFERSHPEECLTIKMVVQSEDEEFIPNWHHIGYCEIIDNLGNHFWPIGMGVHASTPPETIGGGIVQAYARFRYVPEATSITLRQKVADGREEDCDSVLFEDVKLTDRGVSKRTNDLTITYNGVRTTEIRDPQDHQKTSRINQVQIQLQERGNPKYVGVSKITDNLGNKHNTRGFSWNLVDKTREGFMVEGLAPSVESISFKYLLARKVLDFQFSDLPIPR